MDTTVVVVGVDLLVDGVEVNVEGLGVVVGVDSTSLVVVEMVDVVAVSITGKKKVYNVDIFTTLEKGPLHLQCI